MPPFKEKRPDPMGFRPLQGVSPRPKTERVRNPRRSTPVNVTEYSKSAYFSSTVRDAWRDEEYARGCDVLRVGFEP